VNFDNVGIVLVRRGRTLCARHLDIIIIIIITINECWMMPSVSLHALNLLTAGKIQLETDAFILLPSCRLSHMLGEETLYRPEEEE